MNEDLAYTHFSSSKCFVFPWKLLYIYIWTFYTHLHVIFDILQHMWHITCYISDFPAMGMKRTWKRKEACKPSNFLKYPWVQDFESHLLSQWSCGPMRDFSSIFTLSPSQIFFFLAVDKGVRTRKFTSKWYFANFAGEPKYKLWSNFVYLFQLFIIKMCTLMDDSTFTSRKSSLRAFIWYIYISPFHQKCHLRPSGSHPSICTRESLSSPCSVRPQGDFAVPWGLGTQPELLNSKMFEDSARKRKITGQFEWGHVQINTGIN